MEINTYNISEHNQLSSSLFFKCHELIDNIEEFTKQFISKYTSRTSFISQRSIIHNTAIIGDNVFIDKNVKTCISISHKGYYATN